MKKIIILFFIAYLPIKSFESLEEFHASGICNQLTTIPNPQQCTTLMAQCGGTNPPANCQDILTECLCAARSTKDAIKNPQNYQQMAQVQQESLNAYKNYQSIAINVDAVDFCNPRAVQGSPKFDYAFRQNLLNETARCLKNYSLQCGSNYANLLRCFFDNQYNEFKEEVIYNVDSSDFQNIENQLQDILQQEVLSMCSKNIEYVQYAQIQCGEDKSCINQILIKKCEVNPRTSNIIKNTLINLLNNLTYNNQPLKFYFKNIAVILTKITRVRQNFINFLNDYIYMYNFANPTNKKDNIILSTIRNYTLPREFLKPNEYEDYGYLEISNWNDLQGTINEVSSEFFAELEKYYSKYHAYEQQEELQAYIAGIKAKIEAQQHSIEGILAVINGISTGLGYFTDAIMAPIGVPSISAFQAAQSVVQQTAPETQNVMGVLNKIETSVMLGAMGMALGAAIPFPIGLIITGVMEAFVWGAFNSLLKQL